jgi:hypothetical protein
LLKAEIPLAGLWIQDWMGIRITTAGVQLWWDWRLDESYYPDWHQLVADIEKQGGRMMIYINPFLTNTKGHDELFNEAVAKDYLVKTTSGEPFLNKNTNFYAGLIDLTNPETRTWIKGIIKDVLIGKAGASGWMADFGEALPFNGKLYDDADPTVRHNRFPREWAKVNREAIEEARRGDDIVFFTRSGFTTYSTLFWLGDQMETWGEYDGIKTAVVGLLSGGVSGFSLLHSDTGGYVSLSLKIAGHKIPGRMSCCSVGWSLPRSRRFSGPTKGSIRQSRRSSTRSQRTWRISRASRMSAKDSRPTPKDLSLKLPTRAIRWRGISSCIIRAIRIRTSCAINSCSVPTSWSRRCWTKVPMR